MTELGYMHLFLERGGRNLHEEIDTLNPNKFKSFKVTKRLAKCSLLKQYVRILNQVSAIVAFFGFNCKYERNQYVTVW